MPSFYKRFLSSPSQSRTKLMSLNDVGDKGRPLDLGLAQRYCPSP
jgi:hypothetical protein